jgi:hypothetical protein
LIANIFTGRRMDLLHNLCPVCQSPRPEYNKTESLKSEILAVSNHMACPSN